MASTTSRRLALSLAASVLVAGCARKSDARLEKLSAGIARESVQVVMGDSAHRVDQFLLNSNFIEALYFTLPGAGTDSAATADREMSPVILVNGKLVGWGWKQWDSIATANKVPVAPDPKS